MKRIVIDRTEIKRFYEIEGLSISGISEKYGCSTATILRRLHEFNLNVRPVGKLKIPKVEKSLSKEKAYILGVLCGDGYVSKSLNLHEVGLRTIDREFALEFLSNFKRTFGLDLKMRILPQALTKIRGKIYRCKKQFHVRTCSRKVYEDLIKYGNISVHNSLNS